MSSPVAAPAHTEALHTLLETSTLLLETGSDEQLLCSILDRSNSLLAADAYEVWRKASDGRVWRTIAQRGFSDAQTSNWMNSKTVEWSSAAVPDDVWIVADLNSDEPGAFCRPANEAGGMRSAMTVPWILEAEVRGAITYYWRDARVFTVDATGLAVALSSLASSVLMRMELYEQHQREKQRLAFLAEASALLASSLDYESTLDRVAHLAVPQIAEWCVVHVTEYGATTRVAMAHADPSMASFAEEYALKYPEEIHPDRGLGKVLAGGEPEVVSHITEEMLSAAAIDEEHLRLLRRMKLSSSIVVPLLLRDTVLGAIRLLGTDGHYFGPGDVQLALDLGRRAAVAIDNARLHSAMLEQASELRLSHAAAKMGSWNWDLERDRLSWSAEFRALHGLPPEAESTSEAGYELVHPEDRERSRREFWAVLKSDATVFHSEHRSLTPEGRVLWLQVRGRIRRNAAGKAIWVAGLIIDVTDSRLAEQALRRTEKLAATGRLAATVAHEVNNPLESLVNLIYLAQQVEDLPEEAARHLRVADAELRRIAQIVRQTLGFYRETSSPHRTEMRTLVTEVLDLYRSRGEARGLTIPPISGQRDELYSLVVAGEMRQVLANLIGNAMDATPAGGTVEASVRAFGDWVEISVEDTGTGIPDANRKHLFEPFFTTKEGIGTGLGLWVSKGIVEKHQGTIEFENRRERGTTVRVRVPRLVESALAP